MATNQVFLLSQIVPNLWGSRRGLLEGLSLLGPPSCSASWPASLMERVTAVPAPQNVPGSSKTPTKSNHPPSGAVKATPDSGKKSHQSAKQVARLFWGDPERGKEDAEVRKQEEKRRKKSTRPVLSLDGHEDLVTDHETGRSESGFPASQQGLKFKLKRPGKGSAESSSC